MKKKVVEKPKAKASVKKPVAKKVVQSTPSLPQAIKQTGPTFLVRMLIEGGTCPGTSHFSPQLGSWDEVIKYLEIQDFQTRQGVKQIEIEFRKVGVS